MVPIYIAENPEISAYAKAVYLSLKSHYPIIRCSIAHIMAQTGISRMTVLKAIKELEKWNLIKTEKKHRSVTTYKINLEPKLIKTSDYVASIKKSWVH